MLCNLDSEKDLTRTLFYFRVPTDSLSQDIDSEDARQLEIQRRQSLKAGEPEPDETLKEKCKHCPLFKLFSSKNI